MIKKILILIVIILLVVPSGAMANDGGAGLDDKDYMTIKISVDKKECTIGEPITFKLSLTNNTKYPITFTRINSILEGDDLEWLPGEDYFWGDFDGTIEVGKKVELEVSCVVTDVIKWYKKDADYYVNLDLSLTYNAAIYPEYEDDPYWHVINSPLKPIPLKITNLYNGSEYLSAELNETESTFYFPESQNHERIIYDGELESILYNQLSIQNISNSTISDIYIRNESKKPNDESITKLNPGHKYSTFVYSWYYLSPKNTPEKLLAEYKVIFKVDNLYYCNEIINKYATEVLYAPKVTIDFRKKDNSKYIASITNTSGEELENLFFSFKKSRNYIDFDSNHIDVFNKYDTFDIEFDSYTEPKHYFIGLVREKKLYFWEVMYPSYEVYHTYYEDDFFIRLAPLIETPSSSPIPMLTATPKPTKVPTSTPSSSPAITPTEAPTPTLSPTDEPMIEVMDVKKSSSIPLWVWIVLPIAIITAGILVFIIRKKKGTDSLKDKEVNNPTDDD